MKVKIQLKEAVRNDAIVDALGLNPWCVNEGADSEAWVEVEVENIGKVIKEPAHD